MEQVSAKGSQEEMDQAGADEAGSSGEPRQGLTAVQEGLLAHVWVGGHPGRILVSGGVLSL